MTTYCKVKRDGWTYYITAENAALLLTHERRVSNTELLGVSHFAVDDRDVLVKCLEPVTNMIEGYLGVTSED